MSNIDSSSASETHDQNQDEPVFDSIVAQEPTHSEFFSKLLGLRQGCSRYDVGYIAGDGFIA